jgi:hypothetical protein
VPRAQAVGPADVAWLLTAPVALLTVAAIVLLGPPLGHALLEPTGTHFFPGLLPDRRPEPVEHSRYLIALLGPLALAGIVLAWRPTVPGRRRALAAAGVRAAELLLVAALIAAVVVQRATAFRFTAAPAFHTVYFTLPTLAVAALLTVLCVALLGRRTVLRAIARRTRETGSARWAALGVALVATAVWLLPAINTDATIGRANEALVTNAPYWLDETFAVLNGRAPLVDFHSQYGQLWPYLAAGPMLVLGTSFGVFAAIMATATGAALMATYALLRRVVRRSLLALALYLPLLATSLFLERGPLDNRWAPSDVFSLFPMRYGGPLVLAWLTARHVDGAWPRRPAWLFLAAGLVAINNVEFGIPALGATLAAALWSDERLSWRGAGRLAAEAAAGLLAAAVLVAALTLAVAGSLPHYGRLTEFPRLFGVDGWGMLPMHAYGFQVVLYVTFAAAIVLATVRAVTGEEDRLLTAMLAWAGVFGLGVGSYFAGRSHPEVLVDLFCAWALALALLLVAVVRAILARPGRRPAAAELAVLFALGLMVCSLAQIPTPWSQVERLGRTTPTPAFTDNATERFVASVTTRGEPVALLVDAGHRVAYDLGLDNVSPYASIESMPSEEQFRTTLDALRRAHGHKLFAYARQTLPEQGRAFERGGLRLVRTDRRSEVLEYVAR